MKSSRGLSYLHSLLNHRFQDLGVTVTLVSRGVATEEVKVLPIGCIPNIDTLASCYCNGEWLVIMSAVLEILVDIVLVIFPLWDSSALASSIFVMSVTEGPLAKDSILSVSSS